MQDNKRLESPAASKASAISTLAKTSPAKPDIKPQPCISENESKQKLTPPSGDSSSDSVFTDALTPGCSTEINQCYYSEESVNLDVEVPDNTHSFFLQNLTLNNFKLNEYSAKREEEISKKLSKLGVSKTSQISLDSDPKECFVSDNIEVVKKVERDSGHEDMVNQDFSESYLQDDSNECSKSDDHSSSTTNGGRFYFF